MPSIRVKDNEPAEVAMRRFKRACEKAGLLTEMRRREFYEKPTEERKRLKAAAVKRQWKRILRETNPLAARQAAAKSAAKRNAKRGGGDRR